MGLINSHFAEDGMGRSATRVVPFLVEAGARPRRLKDVVERDIWLC